MIFRQWNKIVLISTTVILALIGTLNYVINPYGLYATSIIPPLILQPRNDKYQLLQALSTPPATLLLGSSRLFLMRPLLIQELTGETAFNASVTLAMPRDYLIFARYAVRQQRPHRIIAAIDLQALHPYVEWDQGTWLAASPLRFYADEQPIMQMEKFIASLFNGQQAVDSVRAVVRYWRIGTPNRPYYNTDGSVTNDWIPADDTLARGSGQVTDPNFWTTFSYLDPARLEELRTFFALCAAQHIQVVVLLMPFDTRALTQLQQQPNFIARKADYLAFLLVNQAAYGLIIRDYTDPRSYGGQGEGFSDYYHPLQNNVDLLTRVLFASLPKD